MTLIETISAYKPKPLEVNSVIIERSVQSRKKSIMEVYQKYLEATRKESEDKRFDTAYELVKTIDVSLPEIISFIATQYENIKIASPFASALVNRIKSPEIDYFSEIQLDLRIKHLARNQIILNNGVLGSVDSDGSKLLVFVNYNKCETIIGDAIHLNYGNTRSLASSQLGINIGEATYCSCGGHGVVINFNSKTQSGSKGDLIKDGIYIGTKWFRIYLRHEHYIPEVNTPGRRESSKPLYYHLDVIGESPRLEFNLIPSEAPNLTGYIESLHILFESGRRDYHHLLPFIKSLGSKPGRYLETVIGKLLREDGFDTRLRSYRTVWY